MYNYLFTNDLRISDLDNRIITAARKISDNMVPTHDENKSENNNINTLKFYFSLYENSNTLNAATNGNTRGVILNFIKKFQYPNKRTEEAYRLNINEGIILAPLRTIVKLLYMMNILKNDASVFVTKYEIV